MLPNNSSSIFSKTRELPASAKCLSSSSSKFANGSSSCSNTPYALRNSVRTWPARRSRTAITEWSSDAMIAQAERVLVEKGYLDPGDEVIIVAGFTELKGVANMVKVIKVSGPSDE